ncbi:hypothetical protein HMPREF0293_1305 [Corynebacterium glucuronolyticum ATCC 51866]|uniref:Uncharacterized protein n=1 Tax=Corynebacterium glucuronolyticum ATCC 51866 TaxID=548478 RepID=A0ABM9XQF1_9CORY|nr:hypothetical protein HMPREF0293_1305 [Corynebacterium glucuronolyticum ATCC 51866]
MWRFKNFVDIVVVVFSLRPSLFFVYFFLYAFVLLERFYFFGLSCFLLVQLFLLESLILAQDERWRRA